MFEEVMGKKVGRENETNLGSYTLKSSPDKGKAETLAESTLIGKSNDKIAKFKSKNMSFVGWLVLKIVHC